MSETPVELLLVKGTGMGGDRDEKVINQPINHQFNYLHFASVSKTF
jgi:hypothetical protein